jgi:peroxiredoxin (alkyl hydroperoxide reductase subunit C)
MKKLIQSIILTLLVLPVFSQGVSNPLITGKAPSFIGESTQGEVNFPSDYFGKWTIIFSHPADFTPVCTSEILELAAIQQDFKKLNTTLLVISTDGLNSHIEWVKSMESINYKNYGKLKINFPIISDADLNISRKYGIIQFDVLLSINSWKKY